MTKIKLPKGMKETPKGDHDYSYKGFTIKAGIGSKKKDVFHVYSAGGKYEAQLFNLDEVAEHVDGLVEVSDK